MSNTNIENHVSYIRGRDAIVQVMMNIGTTDQSG